MAKIKIVTDSAADLLKDDISKLNIEVLPFYIAMGDEALVSNSDLDNEKFYEMMEAYDGIPTTSQITPYNFTEYFEKWYEEGCEEVVLVLINSKGSATFNNAVMAKEEFFEEHPEANINIYIYDGASYNGGYGWAVLEAAKAVQDNKPIEDVLEIVDKELSCKKIYFGMYSLKYAGKSGRIPSAAAFVGDVIGLKPVMEIWDHSINTANKAKGEKKLMNTIVDMTLDNIREGSEYGVVYGSDKKVGEDISRILTEKLGYAPKYFFQAGAAVAINAGPRVVGVIFDCKETIEVTRK